MTTALTTALAQIGYPVAAPEPAATDAAIDEAIARSCARTIVVNRARVWAALPADGSGDPQQRAMIERSLREAIAELDALSAPQRSE